MWSRFVTAAIIFIFIRCSNSSTLHVVNITSCCCSCCGLKANLKWIRRQSPDVTCEQKETIFFKRQKWKKKLFCFHFSFSFFVCSRTTPCCPSTVPMFKMRRINSGKSLFIDLSFTSRLNSHFKLYFSAKYKSFLLCFKAKDFLLINFVFYIKAQQSF